ncbi:unnamed protein product [Prunus armeniaca]|uniref:Uncharacterized protein n=1 Tax=Prunus armeniaca TaxID=36596 RepID=A0A6J5WSR6_PRUAR|nr:unnamed protein product [Prunus armeniaca]
MCTIEAAQHPQQLLQVHEERRGSSLSVDMRLPDGAWEKKYNDEEFDEGVSSLWSRGYPIGICCADYIDERILLPKKDGERPKDFVDVLVASWVAEESEYRIEHAPISEAYKLDNITFKYIVNSVNLYVFITLCHVCYTTCAVNYKGEFSLEDMRWPLMDTSSTTIEWHSLDS